MKMLMQQHLVLPQGEFTLYRYPRRKRELLQAWDAADEYLLNYLHQHQLLDSNHRLVIYNDSFGVLATALNHYHPISVSDSFLSHKATRQNLEENGINEDSVTLLTSLEAPESPVDIVLIKIPKSLAMLEYQLITLRTLINAKTKIVLAGMVKGLTPNVWKLIERLIGSTKTSLAVKKARLIFTQLDLSIESPSNPYPINYTLEGTDFSLLNHANVFSRDKLDIGTRLFLQHLPSQTDAVDIIDLGCGNGVVGIISAQKMPRANLHFIDESFMAVASAQMNFIQAFGSERIASYHVGNCLDGFEAKSADLILCNPPFHQQSAIGDHIALQMFKQSVGVLKGGGELWVVGNRHLGYHAKLKRFFKIVELVASNKKFVILKAIKSSPRDNQQ